MEFQVANTSEESGAATLNEKKKRMKFLILRELLTLFINLKNNKESFIVKRRLLND